MHYTKINTQQTEEFLPLALAKSYLKVDYADDDDLIQMLVSACISLAERAMYRDILETTYEARALAIENSCIEFVLRKAGFMSLLSIEYLHKDGTWKTLDPSQYQTAPSGHYCCCKVSIPSDIGFAPFYNFRVQFKVKTQTDDIKMAVLQNLASAYENRGDCSSVKVPCICDAVYQNYIAEDIIAGSIC